MQFISKVKDPKPESKESVYDKTTEKFFDFVGGVFETEDEGAIESLKKLGYETIDAPAEETTNVSFKCGLCDFVAKSNAGLSAHVRNHKETE